MQGFGGVGCRLLLGGELAEATVSATAYFHLRQGKHDFLKIFDGLPRNHTDIPRKKCNEVTL
ncbi:hypothetical protein HMPREF9098_0073 [Kingella denitrificans ATCC 33394]|uniref:Uncharacterized protein n=1 Tax=Kingella denitrificans ATCC 33394 TaxID=888741 RepID=F0EW39_9NEIS|nr:hypothetical protein HMPREF9098_0073 [Kingella denitrificans ATCC 33394]